MLWGGFKKRILTALSAVILMGAGLLLIALTPSHLFVMALIGNLLFTGMRPLIDGSLFAMLQAIIPAEKQGRVLSIILSGSAAAALGGLLIAGPIVDATSLPLWFGLAGITSMVIGITGWITPTILRIETSRSVDLETKPAVP